MVNRTYFEIPRIGFCDDRVSLGKVKIWEREKNSNFEYVIKDWNCDNDVYGLCGLWLKQLNGNHSFIIDNDFKYDYVEFTEPKERQLYMDKCMVYEYISTHVIDNDGKELKIALIKQDNDYIIVSIDCFKIMQKIEIVGGMN